MKSYKIILAIILLVITATGVKSSKQNLLSDDKVYGNSDPKLINQDYFLNNRPIKMTYNSSLGEAYAEIKKNDDRYILDLSNDKFYFIQTVFVKNDTIYLTKLDQKVDVFLFISSEISVTYNKPYLRFPFPLSEGDTWNWDGVEYIDGKNPDTINVSGKVLGYEKIKTEAGSFDCAKFQIDIRKKESGSHTRFYEWRAPEIGLVKLEAYIDSKGFIGKVMKLLGYDEMKFELKKIG